MTSISFNGREARFKRTYHAGGVITTREFKFKLLKMGLIEHVFVSNIERYTQDSNASIDHISDVISKTLFCFKFNSLSIPAMSALQSKVDMKGTKLPRARSRYLVSQYGYLTRDVTRRRATVISQKTSQVNKPTLREVRLTDGKAEVWPIFSPLRLASLPKPVDDTDQRQDTYDKTGNARRCRKSTRARTRNRHTISRAQVCLYCAVLLRIPECGKPIQQVMPRFSVEQKWPEHCNHGRQNSQSHGKRIFYHQPPPSNSTLMWIVTCNRDHSKYLLQVAA